MSQIEVVCAVFHTHHQTSGTCTGVSACNRTHQMEKTAVLVIPHHSRSDSYPFLKELPSWCPHLVKLSFSCNLTIVCILLSDLSMVSGIYPVIFACSGILKLCYLYNSVLIQVVLIVMNKYRRTLLDQGIHGIKLFMFVKK